MLHAPLLDNGQGKKLSNDGALLIATENMIRTYDRDNRGNNDINAPVDMNIMPTTVPIRA